MFLKLLNYILFHNLLFQLKLFLVAMVSGKMVKPWRYYLLSCVTYNLSIPYESHSNLLYYFNVINYSDILRLYTQAPMILIIVITGTKCSQINEMLDLLRYICSKNMHIVHDHTSWSNFLISVCCIYCRCRLMHVCNFTWGVRRNPVTHILMPT